MTTLIVVVVLYLYGGNVLQPFSIALIIGVILGTYSSIFIASPILRYLKVSSKTLEKKEETIVP